jgi:hypothetical protein
VRRAGYLGDSAGAGGDVLEDCPALREQGEPTLAAAAQVAQQRVPGARVDIQFLVSGGVFRGPRMLMTAPSQPGSAAHRPPQPFRI